MVTTAAAIDIPRLRTACDELVRSVRRTAKPLGLESDVDGVLAKLHGGTEPPETFTLGDWWQRKGELYGWLRHYLTLQLVRGGPASDADYIRLQTYAEQPERVELTTGYVVACYPVTLPRADRIRLRADLLQALTLRAKSLEGTSGAPVETVYRLNRERLWQRMALLYEATLPSTSLLELPVSPPVAGRLALRLLAWLDGGNAWSLEAWRTRWLLAQCWRLLGRLTGAHVVFGLPPWWCWLATPVDELAVMRAHLAANDERARGLPPLPSGRGSEQWGWSGFVSALAESRGKLSPELMRDRSLLSMITETAQAQVRAQRQAQELEKTRKKGAGKGKARR